MLDWVLGNKGKKKKASKRKRPPYEKAKEIAAEGSAKERRDLASHEDLEPELLYYFATDQSAEVRGEVARNEGTPLQADEILCRDENDEVRLELARKIGRLVPAFGEQEQERLIEMAIGVLEVLAQDQLPQVRAIISEEIKSAANVPEHIIKKLAHDVEEIVSAPVIQYSPLLSAEDLLEIVAGGVGEEALTALSKRQNLMEKVADAIVETHNKQATKALLENRSADIGDNTLDAIASVAVGAVELHKPMVKRENMPLRVVRRIAGFVSSSLLETLINHSGLDEDLAKELRQSTRQRIDKGDFAEDEADREPADERAKKMHADGKLDEDVIIQAMDDKDLAFVRYALALMSGLTAGLAKEMLGSGSGKTVTALAWKAGLSMRAACALQAKVAHIQPKSMMKAIDGDYPMSDDELAWYIDYFKG